MNGARPTAAKTAFVESDVRYFGEIRLGEPNRFWVAMPAARAMAEVVGRAGSRGQGCRGGSW